jgi:hypothetical protein
VFIIAQLLEEVNFLTQIPGPTFWVKHQYAINTHPKGVTSIPPELLGIGRTGVLSQTINVLGNKLSVFLGEIGQVFDCSPSEQNLSH